MSATLAPESTMSATEMRGVLAVGRRRAYALAGDATITVRSTRTGTRYTYKIRQSDPRPGSLPVWFVSLLNGEDNTGDYQYLGTIFADGFRVTRKSRLAADAPSVIAFNWLARNWESERVEVWHEGSCGRCGRTLTVPESIESGIGPTCAEKMGLEIPAAVRTPRPPRRSRTSAPASVQAPAPESWEAMVTREAKAMDNALAEAIEAGRVTFKASEEPSPAIVAPASVQARPFTF